MTRRGPVRPGETLTSLLGRTAELSAPVLGQLLFVVTTVEPNSAVVDLLLRELRQIAAEDAAGTDAKRFGVVPGSPCRLCAFRRSPFAQLSGR